MAAHDGKLQFLLIGIGHRAGRFLRDAVRLPEDNPPLQKEPLPGLHGVGASLYDNEVTFGIIIAGLACSNYLHIKRNCHGNVAVPFALDGFGDTLIRPEHCHPWFFIHLLIYDRLF